MSYTTNMSAYYADTEKLINDVQTVREERGLTVSDASRFIGINAATLCNLLQGNNDPSLNTFVSMVKFVGKPFNHYVKRRPGAVVWTETAAEKEMRALRAYMASNGIEVDGSASDAAIALLSKLRDTGLLDDVLKSLKEEESA